jgi:hypothetical protein
VNARHAFSGQRWLLGAISLLLAACHPQASRAPRFEAQGPSCAPHQRELVSFVERLPEHTLSVSARVALPESIIGELPGAGALLEIGDDFARFENAELAGRTLAERAEQAGTTLAAFFASNTGRDLYVAAARSTDVETLRAYLRRVPLATKVRLLVRMPAEDVSAGQNDTEARELADELLAERDPARRAALSHDAFARFSRCPAVLSAVDTNASEPPERRWPALRAALTQALPSCRCDELAPDGLKQIVVAEQRAGTATLAALPFGFVRDERCGASMPLRSLAKLLQQMESFDQEFSGSFERDALSFERVLTDERLLNTFCNALPGETLLSLAKKRGTLYFKTSAGDACEALRFEPLSAGAPMGTLRLAANPAGSGRAFHYWQGAEEIRVFGPLSEGSGSKPTDDREWPCSHELKLVGVDANSIEFEKGRWFFTEAACRAAPTSAAIDACFTKREAAP